MTWPTSPPTRSTRPSTRCSSSTSTSRSASAATSSPRSGSSTVAGSTWSSPARRGGWRWSATGSSGTRRLSSGPAIFRGSRSSSVRGGSSGGCGTASFPGVPTRRWTGYGRPSTGEGFGRSREWNGETRRSPGVLGIAGQSMKAPHDRTGPSSSANTSGTTKRLGSSPEVVAASHSGGLCSGRGLGLEVFNLSA